MKAMPIIAIFLTFLSSQAIAETQLTLIGGGKRPPSALLMFLSHVKPNQTVWVLPWGTSSPDESFKSISSELSTLGFDKARCICDFELTPEIRLELESAGGFYFPGGDQNLIMQRLVQTDLLETIRKQYAEGAPVAGTSAGTAIQTDPMLTGGGSSLGSGLGLLSKFLVDQHFWVRERQARLLTALEYLRSTQNIVKVGLGIDEGMAVQISNGSHLRALGPSRASLYRFNNRSSKFEKIDLFDQDEVDVFSLF